MSIEHQTNLEQSYVRKVMTRVIPLLMVLYIIAFVDRSAIAFAKLTMSADIGLSEAAYGLGAGLFFIGYFLFEVPSNLAMHKFGAKLWFARILLTWGIITMLLAIAWNPMSFYVLRFLLGAAEAGLFPGVIYYLTIWFTSEERKSATARFVLAQPIGLLVMAPIAGVMLEVDWFGFAGWKWLFIVMGGVAVVAVWPTLALLPSRPRNAKWLTQDEKDWIEGALAREVAEFKQTDHKNPLKALADGRVLYLSSIYLMLCIGVYGLSLWLPTVVNAFSGSVMSTGWISAIPYIFAILGLLCTPWFSRRVKSSYTPLAVAFGGAAIGLATATAVASPVLQMAFLSFCAFFLFPTTATFWPIPSAILVGATAATGIAAINSIGNLGGFVGPYIVGWLSEVTGNTKAGMFFLAGCLAFGIVLLGGAKKLLPAQITDAPTPDRATRQEE